MTYWKTHVNNCLLASTHFCSKLLRIFALGSCTFLLSNRTQFCSWLVRNFALGSYAILLLARTQFCSWLVRNLLLARMQFCSWLVRNFALGSYAILLLARTQFCSWLVRNFVFGSYAILLSNHRSYQFFAFQPLLVRAIYRATVILCLADCMRYVLRYDSAFCKLLP